MTLRGAIIVLSCLSVDAAKAPRRPALHPPTASAAPSLLAASELSLEPTPAAKLLEVTASTTAEAVTVLCFLRLFAVVVGFCQSPRSRALLSILSWIIVVQGSQRLQGLMQSTTEVPAQALARIASQPW